MTEQAHAKQKVARVSRTEALRLVDEVAQSTLGDGVYTLADIQRNLATLRDYIAGAGGYGCKQVVRRAEMALRSFSEAPDEAMTPDSVRAEARRTLEAMSKMTEVAPGCRCDVRKRAATTPTVTTGKRKRLRCWLGFHGAYAVEHIDRGFTTRETIVRCGWCGHERSYWRSREDWL